MVDFKEEFGEMTFRIDEAAKVSSVSTLTIDSWNNYKVQYNSILLEKHIGGLVIAFIQADFETIDGFWSFVEVWGISGMIDINKSMPALYIERRAYSRDETYSLVSTLFHYVGQDLLEAQKDFRKVIDFCTNVEGRPHLEILNPLQRYYAGKTKRIIPNLDYYSAPLRMIYTPSKPVEEFIDPDLFMELDDYCNKIKEENIIINKTYFSYDIRTFVYLEFFDIIDKLAIKKCASCLNYFVPKNKSNEIYCEQCRSIGYVNKMKEDIVLKAYNTAYKTKHAQRKRQKANQLPDYQKKVDDAFDMWKVEAKTQLSQVQKGEISEEDFLSFLKRKMEV